AEALGQEQVHHVAADEAGAPGDDGSGRLVHAASPFFLTLRTLKYRSSSMLRGIFPALKARHRSRTASSAARRGRNPSRSAILREQTWYERMSSVGLVVMPTGAFSGISSSTTFLTMWASSVTVWFW